MSGVLEFEQDYRKAPGINASAICAGLVSMRHMRHVMTGGEFKDSPSKKLGRQAHMAVLQPRMWQANRLVWELGNKAGKAWESFASNALDADLIVTTEQDNDLRSMSDAVWAHSECAWLLDGVTTERPIYWYDWRCGACKARVDADKPGILLDYKTTGKIDTASFFRSVYNLHYVLRMGWYCRGIEATTGKRPEVYLIVQESAAPWDCYPVHISAAMIKDGEAEAVETAVLYRCCEASGSFPGVAGGLVEYEPPAWTMAESEEIDITTGQMEGSAL